MPEGGNRDGGDKRLLVWREIQEGDGGLVGRGGWREQWEISNPNNYIDSGAHPKMGRAGREPGLGKHELSSATLDTRSSKDSSSAGDRIRHDSSMHHRTQAELDAVAHACNPSTLGGQVE